jgi:hypothetical protein
MVRIRRSKLSPISTNRRAQLWASSPAIVRPTLGVLACDRPLGFAQHTPGPHTIECDASRLGKILQDSQGLPLLALTHAIVLVSNPLTHLPVPSSELSSTMRRSR